MTTHHADIEKILSGCYYPNLLKNLDEIANS